jgi:hypothetical protein
LEARVSEEASNVHRKLFLDIETNNVNKHIKASKKVKDNNQPNTSEAMETDDAPGRELTSPNQGKNW